MQSIWSNSFADSMSPARIRTAAVLGSEWPAFLKGIPATSNRLLEMDYFKAKVDAGADYVVTQLFFDNRDFLDFRERCALADIHIPIIAGIMPITSIGGFKRIAELAGGARFPAKLLRALQRCQNDPEMVKRVGLHFAIEQCHDLLDNDVAGIHFYTLNRSDATRVIFDSLGVPRRRNPEPSECLVRQYGGFPGSKTNWRDLREASDASRICGCRRSAARFAGKLEHSLLRLSSQSCFRVSSRSSVLSRHRNSA